MTEHSITTLKQQLTDCLRVDRYRLRRRLEKLQQKPNDNALEKLAADIARSIAKRARKAARQPKLSWPNLPVVEQLDTIRDAIRDHQVVVLAGETGSGKTTQLPKICLELGRGVEGMIGHTQPRRLAARAVSSRIAEEIGSTVGDLVGYRVRFTDHVGEDCLIKLMTDGMLLSEIQSDRFLDQYDTLIIDEAHERSLNIDFLLGYIRQLLPKRPDLKVIITSATIDHERFAKHFAGAPVIEVSGRTYPVDVHYRPAEAERELSRQVEDVLREIEQLEREKGRPPACDVLVFLSGERDIRELHHHLKRCEFRDTEFLPLYARLSPQEQQRVFAPHRGRRVVLSTNVAETSLTVPGIRYVIDAGTARVSRYSVQSKVQRLPVEPVSKASAEQRKGRSGRVMPGVCYRLYDEDDFNRRPAFTEPEIRRTNLAAVILQMAELRLGNIANFPFIDPPEGSLIRDGYRLLEELGAMHKDQLTATGRQLARLPLDPRLGRMLIAAAEQHSLREVLIIVAAMAVQDPRDRPPEARQQADQAHQPFTDKESDFLFFLKLWPWAEEQREALSRNQYEKLLRKNFLAPMRMQEWRDTHHQLLLQCRELNLNLNPNLNNTPATFEQIHRALLTGLLGNVLKRTEEGDWLSTRSRKPQLWPGSALSKSKSPWLMAAEQVETSRLFARTLAKIEPEWIEQQGSHLVKRSYIEPHWSKKRGTVMATEQVSLFGLLIRSDRKINYAQHDPALARELLIREGLVNGALNREPPFVKTNRESIEALQQEENKLRRRDLLADEEAQVAYYDARLPQDIVSLTHLESWLRHKADDAALAALIMSEEFLLDGQNAADEHQFPASLNAGGVQFALEYQFDPGSGRDGVWIVVPVALLNRLEPVHLDWLVPGWLSDRIEALIRALPKAKRRNFVPVPDYVRAVMARLTPGREALLPALTRELQSLTGVRIEQEEWPEDTLPAHLRFHIRVVDSERTLAEGQDLVALKKQFAEQMQQVVPTVLPDDGPSGRDWVFGDLPEWQDSPHGGVEVRLWPALVDDKEQVTLKWQSDAAQAGWLHRWATARLIWMRLAVQYRELRQRGEKLPGFQKAILGSNAKAILDDALLRIVADHFQLDEPIRDAQSFAARLQQHSGDIVPVADKRLALISEVLSERADLQRSLNRNFPLAWAHAHRDISAQLDALMGEGFLRQTPAPWLDELPRYLKAIRLRIDKLGGQIGKDRATVAELDALWQQYQARAAGRPLWQQPEPLVRYRFMLEEYRVSLFAQQLGTRMPVSDKRLREQWQLC
ncbi:MAG: ATP-dependent RNA helicase HrpA [Alcanivoracaceae bacterium]|nr:ATP-dependent RNA helicase HrpA [Alcanivoracaceae bacterium]